MKVKKFKGFCKVNNIILKDEYNGQTYTCLEKYMDKEVTGFYPRFSLLDADGYNPYCRIQVVAWIAHDFSADSEEATRRLIRNRKIESHRRQIEVLRNCENSDTAVNMSRIAYHEKAIEDLEVERINADKKENEFGAWCERYLEQSGMESYEIWITLLRRNPEKEPEILTIASVNKMSELLFFRSGIQTVIKEKFTPYQCCKTIYDYLVNGYEIQQLSPKCCATVWNHISSRDLSAGDSWTEGVRLFLSYCRQHDITQDYLINKVTGYVENAIYYLDDERISNNKVQSTPAIPEKLEPGFGFKDGCVPVKRPEWKVKQTVAFLRECHALLYAKEGTDFEISCLMSKQSHEGKADFTAVFGIESMAMVIQSGLQSKEISMINSEILSRNILQDLNDGFHMEYMATSMHAQMWLHLSWMGDREKQYYKAGIQIYADYCVEHDITNRLIDAYMNWDFQIPDFLQEWQSMKEKCASQVSMRQDRKR